MRVAQFLLGCLGCLVAACGPGGGAAPAGSPEHPGPGLAPQTEPTTASSTEVDATAASGALADPAEGRAVGRVHVPGLARSGPQTSASCQFQAADQPVRVAFCDSFDAPAGTGNRSGDLNGNVWGVSRASGRSNFGQGQYIAWATTTLDLCGTVLTGVTPPNDVRICNGQLREATNDSGSVTVLAMYPKQPFDFAGRTGTVVFDVTNDTEGAHGAWPEFWLTDTPLPAPFTHFDSWIAAPANGFGIRFAWANSPGCGGKWSVDSVIVSRNHVIDDSTEPGHSTNVARIGCGVSLSSGPNGGLNHVEVRIAQNQIDVYATDAGTSSPLHHIARVSDANLTLTRGLVWIEDVHYSAGKFGSGTHGQHTFAWDNVGFDGPATYRDLSYDVLDRLRISGNGTYDLGWLTTSAAPVTIQTLPVPADKIASAASARLMFSFYHYEAPTGGFTFTLNGRTHTAPWPYPGSQGFTPRTIAIPVPLADLVPGPQVIRLHASQAMIVFNVNIVLVNVEPVP